MASFARGVAWDKHEGCAESGKLTSQRCGTSSFKAAIRFRLCLVADFLVHSEMGLMRAHRAYTLLT